MAQFIAEGINGEITVEVKHIDITYSANIQSFDALDWFAEIPAGTVELTSIPFEIRKSIILTHGYIENGRSAFYQGLPDEISLEVGAKTGYIAFLHTALFQKNSFRWENVEAIAGEYRICYEDGLTIRLPVTVDGNIRNMGSPDSVDLPFEYPALAPAHRTQLSSCCWKNPHPDKSIRSIEIISVKDTTTSIALFAVTAMEDRPWDEKIFSSAQDIQTAARRIRITSWRKKAEKQIRSILREKNLDPDILQDLPVNRSILKVEDSDELLRALDLERTELKAIREASSSGDKKRIEDELAKFLRGKKDWLQKVLKIIDTAGEPPIDTADADKLLNNRFGHSGWSYDYSGKEIDFYAVPKDLKPEPHWYFTHGLQYVGLALADAYAATGNEKYTKRMFDYFRDIIRKCPVEDADGVGDNDYFMPAADADGDGWPDRPGQAQAWEATASSTRLGIWIRCLARSMDSKHLTDELLLSLYKFILEQIRHTYTQSPFYMDKRTNHATSIAYKLIEWAVCFPEFKGAAEWKDMGFEMLQAFYRPFWEGGMIYPDGSTYESHTGGYGSGLLRELDESIKLLELSSFSIPQSLIRTREQMYEWLLYITTPLGYSSSISMVYHDFYGFDVEEVSREAFDATKREDFLYIGSGGKEGNAWRIYADLKNYPALKTRFNTSDIVLDPGLSVTMCLRR